MTTSQRTLVSTRKREPVHLLLLHPSAVSTRWPHRLLSARSLVTSQSSIFPFPYFYYKSLSQTNCLRDEDVRQRAKDALRDLVATASRDLSTEQFTRLNNDINRRIFELCSSSDDKLGGVMAIEALIDLNAEENTKLTRFANYLRLVLPTNDVPTMIAAAKALGIPLPYRF